MVLSWRTLPVMKDSKMKTTFKLSFMMFVDVRGVVYLGRLVRPPVAMAK